MPRPRSRSSILIVPSCLAALLATHALSTAAFADVPPPQECPDNSSAGQSCTTAGPNADLDGVCVSTNCAEPPLPNLPDSGARVSPCVLCMAPGSDAGPNSMLNPCAQVGGNCVAVTPNACPSGQTSELSCLSGVGVQCCLGPSPAPDAGPVPDAGPTPDAGPVATDASIVDGGGQTLKSSSGCSTAGAPVGSGGDTWILGPFMLGLAVSMHRLRRRS
jgi:hypothetical protein